MSYNKFQTEFCHICTRKTKCILIGIYCYCEPCVDMRLRDPDGKADFIKLMNESGVIDIES